MKKLLIVAAVGLLLLLVVAGVGLAFAGSLAKTAIERGGSYALGVPTTLESAELGVLSGRFGMQHLAVANPPGFEAAEFVNMREAEFEVTLGSLSSELVEAPLLRLEGLDVWLEKREGRTNYDVILERLGELQGEGGGEPAEPGPDEGPGKQFVIREVVIADVTAHVDLLPVGGELTKVTIRIPELRLEDVGNDGESVSEIVSELTRVLLAAIVQAGGDVIPADVLGDLQSGLAGLNAHAFQLGQGVVTDVQNRLGGELGQQLGEQAGELLDSANEELDDKLKKLFD